MRRLLSVSLLLLAGLSAVSAQQLSTKKSLNLAVAKAIAMASEKEALKNNFQMFITIIDDGGTLVYLERIDEAQIGSMQVAIDKAQSAIKFKRPTKAFEDAVKGGNLGILKLPGAIATEGGIPLVVDGKVIGAVGVSGGTSAQDAQVAQAGVTEFNNLAGGGK